jgi:hypothetical protein
MKAQPISPTCAPSFFLFLLYLPNLFLLSHRLNSFLSPTEAAGQAATGASPLTGMGYPLPSTAQLPNPSDGGGGLPPMFDPSTTSQAQASTFDPTTAFFGMPMGVGGGDEWCVDDLFLPFSLFSLPEFCLPVLSCDARDSPLLPSQVQLLLQRLRYAARTRRWWYARVNRRRWSCRRRWRVDVASGWAASALIPSQCHFSRPRCINLAMQCRYYFLPVATFPFPLAPFQLFRLFRPMKKRELQSSFSKGSERKEGMEREGKGKQTSPVPPFPPPYSISYLS